jgi:hypothetical protein
VPFPLFERLTEMTRVNARFSEEKDCAGRRAAPLELKILGVLRVLGRGYCFDGIEELILSALKVIEFCFICGANCSRRNISPSTAILLKQRKK